MNDIAYSEDIVKAINTFLTEDNWNFYFDEKHGVFQFGLRIKSKIKKVNYRIYVAENDYMVYAISPLGVDEDDERMLAAMAEFICRANYGLVNGNFELDMSDGEIRFKCFVDCDNITPSTEVIRNSIHYPAAMFKQYGSGIADIIFGNASAKEAVANCEGTPLEELRTSGGDDFDEGAGLGTMLARLAERLGCDAGEWITDGEQSVATGTAVEIKPNLFGQKGSNTE